MSAKIKLWILTILTFGWYYFWIKKHAKKLSQQTASHHTYIDHKFDKIDPNLLQLACGGKDNIVNAQANLTTVTLNLKNGNLINKERLTACGATKAFISDNAIVFRVQGSAEEFIKLLN